VVSAGSGFPNSWLFLFLEVCVNLTLATEVALRVISQQKAYCYSVSNIFDCIVLVASVTAMGLFFSGEVLFKEIQEGVALVLLAFRYSIAFLRVVILVKNQGKYLKTQIGEVVDLSTVGPHSGIELSIPLEEKPEPRRSEDDSSPNEQSDEKEFGED